MGYETQLEFVGVQLRKNRFSEFRRFVEDQRAAGDEAVPFAYMLTYLRVESKTCGYLDWNLDRSARRMLKKDSGDVPLRLDAVDWSAAGTLFLQMQDHDGDTLAWGKWRHVEEFVTWLCGFCTGGKIIQYSLEGDGAVGGWEFNRRGEYRELVLVPATKWTKPRR